eukprot:COSAG01_NODE_43288_length_431_cov_0.909639_1_plen_100_part_01
MDPGGIIASAMGGDDQKPVVNEPMLIPAGGDDQPMQVDEPVNDLRSFLYHVPEPVKSEVVDLTRGDEALDNFTDITTFPNMCRVRPTVHREMFWRRLFEA